MKLKTEYITEHNRFWSEINNLAFICVMVIRKQACFYHTLVLITKCSVWRMNLM